MPGIAKGILMINQFSRAGNQQPLHMAADCLPGAVPQSHSVAKPVFVCTLHGDDCDMVMPVPGKFFGRRTHNDLADAVHAIHGAVNLQHIAHESNLLRTGFLFQAIADQCL